MVQFFKIFIRVLKAKIYQCLKFFAISGKLINIVSLLVYKVDFYRNKYFLVDN